MGRGTKNKGNAGNVFGFRGKYFLTHTNCPNKQTYHPTTNTKAYEQEHMVYAQSNVAIANSTIELLLSRAPAALHPFGRKVVSSLLTPRLQKAFNMPAPSWAFVTMIKSILWLRGGFIKYFMLPRNIPVIRTPPRANKEGRYVPLFNKYEPVYPNGYTIDELGPDKFRGKCPVPHNVTSTPHVL